MKIHRLSLFSVAFVEGAVVMAAEIAAAKLIAPWFGSSLYVWSSVLGVTMAGLALGYFGGGALSMGSRLGLRLALVLGLAGAFVSLMPITGPAVMAATIDWEPRWGSLVASLVFLFPPILLLGMVSPMLVALRASASTAATPAIGGKAAGMVYGVSTLGGIAMTFAMGFWLLPAYGLRLPLVLLGVVLIVAAALVFWGMRKFVGVGAMGLLLCSSLGVAALGAGPLFAAHPGELLLAESGIMGELEVRETWTNRIKERSAYLNGQEQTRLRFGAAGVCGVHPYVAVMSRLAGLQVRGARTLLLGLGGGSLLRELQALGHAVEGCELDARMIALSQDYFGVAEAAKAMRAADARVCINQMEGKYDLVIADVFWGQQGPSHVLTVESLERIHSHLAVGGMLAILFPGPLEHAHAQGMIHTMRTAGFQVAQALPDGLGATGLILLGTHLPYSPQYFQPQAVTPCATAAGMPAFIPGGPLTAAAGSPLYTDDRPQLEALFMRIPSNH